MSSPGLESGSEDLFPDPVFLAITHFLGLQQGTLDSFCWGKFADKHIHGCFSTGATGNSTPQVLLLLPTPSMSSLWLSVTFAKVWHLFLVFVNILDAYLIMRNDCFYSNFLFLLPGLLLGLSVNTVPPLLEAIFFLEGEKQRVGEIEKRRNIYSPTQPFTKLTPSRGKGAWIHVLVYGNVYSIG